MNEPNEPFNRGHRAISAEGTLAENTPLILFYSNFTLSVSTAVLINMAAITFLNYNHTATLFVLKRL